MKYRYAAVLAIILSAALLLNFGCSDSDTGTGGDNGGDLPGGSVGPEGDTLEIPGELMFIIPPGALTDTVEFTLDENTSPTSPPGNLNFVSKVYTIGPSGTNFQTPATVKFEYDESKLGVANENSIEVYTDFGGGWNYLATTVDTDLDMVTVETWHLSDFAALADTSTEEIGIGPNGGTLTVAGMSLAIPPGALSETVYFTVSVDLSPTSSPGTMDFVTPAFSIGPVGTTFSTPATLTLDYDEADLGGRDEMGLLIYGNPGSGWQPLGSVVDSVDNQIVSGISFVSEFAGLIDTASVSAEGIFASLVVGRNISYMGAGDPLNTDAFEARFDSAYAPCDPLYPINNVTVTCNDTALVWSELLSLYMYPETLMPMNDFITLGATYTFDISGPDVEPLTESITFPSGAPYITYPTSMDVENREGFEVTWAGSGSGTVELLFMSDGGDQIIFEETANDGSYMIEASDLSGLPSGTYMIMLNHYNRSYITAFGYDSRSFIAARVQSQTIFQIQ